MNCSFILQDDGRWQCEVCFYVSKRPRAAAPVATCRGAGPHLPSLPRRLLNFGTALAAHAAAGFESCDQATIEARLAICEGCEFFRQNLCRHSECGCHVTSRREFLNKLAWASQSCPIGRWSAETT